MPPQVRLGDKALIPADAHGCPACPHTASGPAILGSTNVLVNGRPAVRVNDPGIHTSCCGPNTWYAKTGSPSVLINGRAAHRSGDFVNHCGGIGTSVQGSANVVVGDRHIKRAEKPNDIVEPAPPRAPPPSLPTQAVAKSFIALELICTKGKPIANARYQMTLSDRTRLTGSLNAQGVTRVEGIDPGTCQIEFPDFAAEEWGATPRPGGGQEHIAKRGDCLASIAADYGFADWHTIWDSPHNTRLRQRRKDPAVLHPGDCVYIPGRESEPVMRPTGQSHRFVLRRAEIRLCIRLKLGTSCRYILSIAGTEHTGQVDDNGLIDFPIPLDAKEGKLLVYPKRSRDLGEAYEHEPLSYDLALGHLDPVEEVTGVQARLNNLGFRCGVADGELGPRTQAALHAFQKSAGLRATGELNEPTREALRQQHDVG